jgi:hypothetical protein
VRTWEKNVVPMVAAVEALTTQKSAPSRWRSAIFKGE